MKPNPNQLQIDFTVPAKDPLTVADIVRSLGIGSAKIYAAIYSGQLEAVDTALEGSSEEHYAIPLRNYIAWLRNEFPGELYFRYPGRGHGDDGFLTPQIIGRVLSKTDEHVRNLIRTGEFPNARNFAVEGKRPRYMIPMKDLVAFVNRRRVGDYN